jgi:probable phosphoglycerate mutase
LARNIPHHQGKTILVVSHGGTIRALIGTATGIKPCNYHTIQQSNSGISILDFENSLTSAKITAINLTQHLGEVLPKLKNGKYGLRLLLLPVSFSNNQANCQLEKLRNFLKTVELDFCFTHDIYDTQLIIESIINQSNPPFILQVSRPDFLDIWHQQISKRSLKSNSLTTGLVIADTKMISNLLSQALGLNSATSLQINSGELSVLFYPKCQSKPVLQTMNITEIF